MKKPSLLWVFAVIVSSLYLKVRADRERCEPITISLCSEIPYNETLFPNIMGHVDQHEAGLEVHQFYPLVKVKCSPNLRLFLCSVYVPMCSEYNRAFPPCRQMCLRAKRGCEHLMNEFGFTWPSALDCDKFPVRETDGVLCFGPDKDYESNPNPILPAGCMNNVGFTCPAHMKLSSANELDYRFMGVENCGAPCDEDKLLYWDKGEKKFASVWIGCWSFLCVISTLFTVLTYLIDMPRFLYPERPIVFLSGCYMMVSIAYIAGFFLHGNVACKQFHSDMCPSGLPISTCPKVVTQGTREVGCTLLFMMVYFFSMASSIWWVVLTVTWFLAAGLKWGNEAIEQKSPYFHGVAWSVPAVQTIAVLISSKIEGDILSGVCYVGVYSASHLLLFLLIPLSLFLLTGTAFLIAGLVAMFNIRNVVKQGEGLQRVEKFERLMVRIGVFSVLYTVPATVTIACYFYEQLNRESWERGWLARDCERYNVPCPCEYNEYKNSKPDFIIFVIKYFMTLIVGITSGFWIWSGKTVESWTLFKDRLCCNNSSTRYERGSQQGQHTITSFQVTRDDSVRRPFYP